MYNQTHYLLRLLFRFVYPQYFISASFNLLLLKKKKKRVGGNEEGGE